MSGLEFAGGSRQKDPMEDLVLLSVVLRRNQARRLPMGVQKGGQSVKSLATQEVLAVLLETRSLPHGTRLPQDTACGYPLIHRQQR